jgi:glycosyltransferase involved in cell wall biosynthesis
MNNKKLKVLLVSPYNAKRVGGIGTWSKSVLNAFEGSDSTSIWFQNTKSFLKFNSKSALNRLVKGAVDTVTILTKLFFNCLFQRPDVIHYTSSASWALSKDLLAIKIAKLFGIPFVIHWHFGRIPEIVEKKEEEYYRLKRVAQLSAKSIAIDKRSYDALVLDGAENACYIPNALPNNVLEASEKERVMPRESGTILFVGHVIKTKGVYELVRSCVNVQGVKQLLIAGPYTEEMHTDLQTIAAAREDGKWLHFLGEIPREEVFEYYRECAVFALPSYTEGFPYVILEAMAFGCPIVATDVGAIPEMITPETGMLIPARDETRLTNAVEALVNDTQKASALGTKARQEVIHRYSTEIVMKQYEEVWMQVSQMKQ